MGATKTTKIDGNVVVNGLVEDLSGAGTYKDISAKTQQQAANQNIIYSTQLANSALSAIADICADNKATPDEKISLESEWEKIQAEYPYILSRAIKAGILATAAVYTNYITAFTNLQTYLETTPGVLQDLTSTTVIAGEAMRALFVLYVNKRELVNAAIQNSTPTYGDLQNGYTDSASGATTTANKPTANITAMFQTVYLQWTKQENLTGKIQSKIYRAVAIDGVYSLIKTVSGYSYIDDNLPLDGTSANPTPKAYFYKISYLVNGVEGPLCDIVSATVFPVPTGSIAAGAITADKIDTRVLNALIANVNSQLTISSFGYQAGDLSDTASLGTIGAYLDNDEIRIKEKIVGSWITIAGIYAEHIENSVPDVGVLQLGNGHLRGDGPGFSTDVGLSVGSTLTAPEIRSYLIRGAGRPSDDGTGLVALEGSTKQPISLLGKTVQINYYAYSAFYGFVSANTEFYGLTQDHEYGGPGCQLSLVSGQTNGTIAFFAGTPVVKANGDYQAPKVGYIGTGGSLFMNGSLIAGPGKGGGADGKAGVLIGNDGSIEISGGTPYIDFHYANSTLNYTSRLYEASVGLLAVTGNFSVGGLLTAGAYSGLRRASNTLNGNYGSDYLTSFLNSLPLGTWPVSGVICWGNYIFHASHVVVNQNNNRNLYGVKTLIAVNGMTVTITNTPGFFNENYNSFYFSLCC